MPDLTFSLTDAVAVLHGQGLLAGVHLPGGLHLAAPEAAGEGSFLEGHFLGAGLDSRALEAGQLFLALQGEHTDGRRFAPAALERGHWVLTRAVEGEDPLQPLAREAGVLLSADPEAALAALAAAWRSRFDLPVVGITGSNGKTTTKDLVTAMLQAAGPTWSTRGNLNNKLGLPLTLLGLRPEHRFAVIEMGASAVGHIAHLAGLARPTVAVITNAARAHLAEFGSLEAVIQGKGEILDNLPSAGRAILNTDSPGFDRWAERAPCPVVSFGQAEGDYLWSWQAAGPGGRPHLDLAGELWPVPLPGQHNAANLAAAILAARAVGVPDASIRQGLQDFHPGEHRSTVLSMAGRLVLDDSYNANPVSMTAAAAAAVQLSGPGPVIAVLGHMAELGPQSEAMHRETGGQLSDCGVQILLAVGAQARPLAVGFAGRGGRAEMCADLNEAADWLARNAVPGSRILIKGSRSAGMEKLVPLLAARWATGSEES
jgi:UDP-N-acetylmuramoyl-tripeptide--D-alanyl-D-alanine ligase